MENSRATVSIVKGDIQETPFNYSEKDLATVRGMIEESLELIGGLSRFMQDAQTVVVKPNLVEVPFKGTDGSVVTDPRVLEALVGLLKDRGVERVLVAEGKSVNLQHVSSGPRQAFPDGIDRPIIVGEYHFGASDRGHFHPGLREADDQKQRAEKFKAYVASALDNPQLVGAHWFQYVDECASGRADGENYNVGLVDVCDTPYREMVAAMREVGATMYEHRSGKED